VILIDGLYSYWSRRPSCQTEILLTTTYQPLVWLHKASTPPFSSSQRDRWTLHRLLCDYHDIPQLLRESSVCTRQCGIQDALRFSTSTDWLSSASICSKAEPYIKMATNATTISRYPRLCYAVSATSVQRSDIIRLTEIEDSEYSWNRRVTSCGCSCGHGIRRRKGRFNHESCPAESGELCKETWYVVLESKNVANLKATQPFSRWLVTIPFTTHHPHGPKFQR
jgi:hypothetical protein